MPEFKCPVSKSLAAAILMNRIRHAEDRVKTFQNEYSNRKRLRLEAELANDPEWIICSYVALETESFQRLEAAEKELRLLKGS